MAKPQFFEAGTSRLRPAALTAFLIGVTIVGIHALRADLPDPLLVLCAWIIVLVCPLLAALQGRRALMSGIAVRVDETGVRDARLGDFVVPWSEIAGIEVVFRKTTYRGFSVSRFTTIPLEDIRNDRVFASADGFLLRVRDIAPYHDAMGWIERFAAWSRSFGDLGGVLVTAKDLAASGGDLATALRTGWMKGHNQE